MTTGQEENRLLLQTNHQDYKTATENNALRKSEECLSVWEISAILSTAFSYGCVNSTLFLITLPVECERIEKQTSIPKSVSLGSFVAIAGLTQLVTPLIGMLSDNYMPPERFEVGRRMPYLILGSVLSIIGLFGQYWFSEENFWFCYGVCFFFVMIGMTISYTMMITLIPDQVPKKQTGVANGILALLLVGGSLFGFELFHLFFDKVIPF
jgi:MFS family permease